MTSNASPGTRILGSLRSADGAGIIRIEDRYDTDIDDLWSAITDPDRLARWFGEVDGELSLGGEFRVQIADAGERTGQVEAELSAGAEIALDLAVPAGQADGIGDRRPEVVDVGVVAVFNPDDACAVC